jgi:hypothetical protein
LRVTSDHHRQISALGTRRAARNGRVHEGCLPAAECICAPAIEPDADGGVVNVELVGSGGLSHVGVDRSNALFRGQSGENDFGVDNDIGER